MKTTRIIPTHVQHAGVPVILRVGPAGHIASGYYPFLSAQKRRAPSRAFRLPTRR